MKRFAHILFCLSLLLILAHNIVAHTHVTVLQTSINENKANADLLEIIQLTLSVDQGKDHLQHFEKTQKEPSLSHVSSAHYSLLYAALTILGLKDNNLKHIIFEPQSSYYTQYFPTTGGLRAPPLHTSLFS